MQHAAVGGGQHRALRRHFRARAALRLGRAQRARRRTGLGLHLVEPRLGVDAVFVEVLSARQLGPGVDALGGGRADLGVVGAGLQADPRIGDDADNLAAADKVALLHVQPHECSGDPGAGLGLVARGDGGGDRLQLRRLSEPDHEALASDSRRGRRDMAALAAGSDGEQGAGRQTGRSPSHIRLAACAFGSWERGPGHICPPRKLDIANMHDYEYTSQAIEASLSGRCLCALR